MRAIISRTPRRHLIPSLTRANTTTTLSAQQQVSRYTSIATNQGQKTSPTTINAAVPGSSSSSSSSPSSSSLSKTPGAAKTTTTTMTDGAIRQPKKTMAELDEELRLKMEGVSGEGGSAGVEYEDGKAEGLKRGLKANMFRVI